MTRSATRRLAPLAVGAALLGALAPSAHADHQDLDVTRQVGTARADQLFGAAGIDLVHAKAGSDTVQGRRGIDVLYGEAGWDVVSGGRRSDFASGGMGRDNVTGGAGSDYVVELGGDDLVSAGAGRDWLAVGHGADVATAGRGDDLVLVLNEHSHDVIRCGPGDDVAIHFFGRDLRDDYVGCETVVANRDADVDTDVDIRSLPPALLVLEEIESHPHTSHPTGPTEASRQTRVLERMVDHARTLVG